MAWNYRKRVKIAPGVYLNISKKGVSTTVGMRGASMNFGKNGTYINTGIPGTGFYSRQKIGGKQITPASLFVSMSGQPKLRSHRDYVMRFWACVVGAFVMLITGLWIGFIFFAVVGVGQFSNMRRTSVSGGDSVENSKLVKAARKELDKSHTELEKRILQNFIDCYTLVDEIDEEEGIIESLKKSGKNQKFLPEHEQKLKEAKDKLNDIQYDVDLELSEKEKSSYEEFCQKFEILLTSDKVWRIDSSERTSQIKSSAKYSLARTATSVGVGIFNYIKSQYDVPIINDRTVQLYFYPKFLIAATSPSSFSVIPYSSVSLNGLRRRFNEEESLPADSKHLGYTWKYVNKSGGPDKRFADNKQLPVMEYGDLTIKYAANSSRFQFSNSDALVAFADSFAEIKSESESDTSFVSSSFTPSEPSNKGEYFKNVSYAANNLYNHVKRLNRNGAVKAMLAKYDEQLSKLDGIGVGEISPRLLIICLSDVIKSYEGLGHKFDLNTDEGLGLANFVVRLISPQHDIVYNSEESMRTDGLKLVKPFLDSFRSSFTTTFPEDKFFVIEMMRADDIDDELVSKYAILLYRFASIIAKADNVVTEKEAKWLEHIMSFASVEGGSKNGSNVKGSSKKNSREEGDSDPEDELKSLIGLAPVKEEVSKLTNFIKIQQMREQKGMATAPMSYHCVFTGNPGTGKTTVARIVAEIYKNLGILKKGHLVETDRSGLVAEYVGQTAVKTNKIIDKALDGVLFIDEAYSLVQGGSNDYGTEAISTLLKRMEDDRDRLVVILAGYSDEMKQFIDSNPGLQSRFNRYINFVDYDADELQKIFMLNINKNEYKLSPEAEQKLKAVLTKAVEEKDKNFGNGRFVRNLFEKTIENQATRLSSAGNITNELLAAIEAIDIPK